MNTQIIKNPRSIFEEYIMREENRRSGKKTIKYYFTSAENNVDGLDSNDENVLDINEPIDIDIEPVKKKRQIKRKPKRNISDNLEESETFILNL